MATTASAELIKKTVPPLTLWAVAKFVELPRVKKTLKRVDSRLMSAAMRKAVAKRTKKSFRFGRVLAGAALIAAGLAVIAGARRAVMA